MDQENIIRIQMIEQEVNQLNQQLQLVEQNIAEMNELTDSLSEIDKDKEILANLGKKVYVPVQIRDDNLIVEVGKGNFVKKNVKETKEIIQREGHKLGEAKNQIMERLGELQAEMNELIMAFQKAHAENKSSKKESIEDLAG